MITQKYTQQIQILLAESFSSVVSDLSQSLWFAKKIFFCRLVLDVQSSCTLSERPGQNLDIVTPVFSICTTSNPRWQSDAQTKRSAWRGPTPMQNCVRISPTFCRYSLRRQTSLAYRDATPFAAWHYVPDPGNFCLVTMIAVSSAAAESMSERINNREDLII